jgi:hypothetical protein
VDACRVGCPDRVHGGWRRLGYARHLTCCFAPILTGLFADTTAVALSQGDIFPAAWDDRSIIVDPVVIVSHDCDIDKADTVLTAAIVQDAATPVGILGDIKAGRVWHALYLAGCEVPGWANWRMIRYVEKAALDRIPHRRVQSMTPIGRAVLAGSVFQYLTRLKPGGARYFRDTTGTIWDAWDVTEKHIRQHTQQLRSIPPEYRSGWVPFLATDGRRRRHLAAPRGWQYLSEPELAALCETAQPVGESDDVDCTVLEDLVRPKTALPGK